MGALHGERRSHIRARLRLAQGRPPRAHRCQGRAVTCLSAGRQAAALHRTGRHRRGGSVTRSAAEHDRVRARARDAAAGRAVTLPAAPSSRATAPLLMRAIVLTDVGRLEPLVVPCPAPRPDEVRVRVEAVGLCGTDLHIVAGHANYNRDARGQLVPLAAAPQFLGHGIAGVVDEVGALVDDVRPGDRVVVDQGRNCFSEQRSPLCEYCATGHSHQCERYAEHGITGLPGGFADYITIPAVNTVRIESDIEPAVAALSEPLGCVLHACETLASAPSRYALAAPSVGESVRTALILGAGPAGLLFVQYT